MDYQAGRRPSYDSRWRTSFDETSLSGHRPVSRRGIHDYSPPLSHIQSSVMRPNSAYRSSTASRLATAGLGQPPSSAARVGTAMTGFSMVDRPITQQGLSGLRTGTARGYRTRQLQDKRYWEELMQVKIREIKAETANLNERADVSERERSANKHYEKRVKELAQELTDLQGRLADYNTAIRISTGAITKSAVINETKEFEGSNQNLEVEVEKAFMEKQRKEVQLKQLKEQMDKERSSLEKLIAKMTATQLERYNELTQNNATLKEEIEHIQSQIEEVNKEKDQTHKEISMSQMKVHLLELYRRLDEAEEKRNTLHKEFDNKLQPHEEREKLLAQVREDNVAIASMESNSSTLKEQINKVQELIDHAEQDLEEGQSERHQKYRELKKREETMELFMETYEENARQEKEKIAQLEKHILFALEHSSMNLDIDLGEIEALKLKDESLYSMTENENARTVEGLTKEYERLQNNLKKLVTTRERLAAELQTLPDKMAAMEEELITLSDLERLRSEGAEKKKSLETELITLKEKLTPTENAVKEAANKLKELQSQLDGNEMYKKLNTLEDKLAQLESSKSVLEEDIASITTKSDYEPIKKDALDTLNIINKKLQDDLHKSLY